VQKDGDCNAGGMAVFGPLNSAEHNVEHVHEEETEREGNKDLDVEVEH